jgi:Serine carboxypeptidase
MAIWHVLQAFLGSFPQYSPGNSTSTTVGVNLFAESYGGKYGPAFASLWDKQNRKRLNGTIPQNGTVAIKLVSLGIVNGCIDDMIQAPFYPAMAVNNTYGLQAISLTRANLASASFYAAGGCQDLISQCRSAVQALDPTDRGNVSSVNDICMSAQESCLINVMEPYSDSGRSYYDIGHLIPDPFPPSTYLEYLNSASFLSAIGSPVNYTESNIVVETAFTLTGDYERDSFIPDIARLLNEGIRVGLIYGDRDYICNWLGGEAVSLSIAEHASAPYVAHFASAGYAPIITNSTYIGGAVRQYGNLSFSRIYDAGHEVPAYQPETAFQVFWRIISGLSISTGEAVDLSAYGSSGPINATHTNSLPVSPSATCWLRNIPSTCTDEQISMIENGNGVIIDGVLYNSESDYTLPSSAAPTAQGSVGSGGGDQPTNTPSKSSVVLTGAYTATATPSMKGAAGLSISEIGTSRISLAIFGSLILVISF